MPTWLLVVALTATARASDPVRLVARHESELFDSSDGLPSSSIGAIMQDERGWIWVTTTEGIARMDGARTVRITGPYHSLVPGSGTHNRIVSFGGPTSVLEEVVGDALRPTGKAVDGGQIDSRGRLWAIVGTSLVLEDNTTWTEIAGPWTAPQMLGASRDGEVFVDDGGTLYRVSSDRSVRFGATAGALRAVERANGTVLVVANTKPDTNDGGTVFAFRDDVASTLYASPHRVIDIAIGGDDAFVNYDFGTLRIDASGDVEQLSPGLNCCGTVLADREGGVWVATLYGVRHYPSPTARTYEIGAILMALAPGGVWLSTWGGFHYLMPDGTIRAGGSNARAPCTDSSGATWALTGAEPARVHPDRPPELFPALPFVGPFVGCALGADGRTWFASPNGILVSDRSEKVPHAVPASLPTPAPTGMPSVLEANGELLLASDNQICRAPVYRVLRDGDAGWSCAELANPGIVVDLATGADGASWAAVSGVGVLRSVAGSDTWTLVPASTSLRTGTLGLMTASPRGGVWVLAEGDAIRVVEDETAAGWSVLERLGEAQGVPGVATPRDLVEAATGDLWLATAEGVTFIPASTRAATGPAPPVFVSSVLSYDGPHDPAEALALPHARSRLELQFSAPVFGRRSQLEYRFRLDPKAAWSAPTRDASLQFAALGMGQYTVDVQASTDGRHWSDPPAVYSFRVRPPWYLQWWFLVGTGTAVLGAILGVQRVRSVSAARLEQQRARIARDLHDEIGSGLGSIGLLASIAGRTQSSTDMTSRIASLAGELGRSLTDIVMSMRSGAANLRSLHAHIVERGAQLCPSGTPRFDAMTTVEIPPVPLTLAVRVNVFYVAVEAIHNAVKHAAARTIQLGLERASRSEWLLTVVDDGRGVPFRGSEPPAHDDDAPGGMGLRGMRERAAEIGAALEWDAAPGGGTVVRLRFDPRADRPRRRRVSPHVVAGTPSVPGSPN